MMQQSQTAETQIKALIEAWADAVRRHDLPGILAHHDQSIVMFDVPPPFQSRGLDEYKKTWDLFFNYHKPGLAFDIEELACASTDATELGARAQKMRARLAEQREKARLRSRGPALQTSMSAGDIDLF